MKKLISLLIMTSHLGVLAVPLIFADSSPPAPSTEEVWKMYTLPGIQTVYQANGQMVNSSLRSLESQMGDVRQVWNKQDALLTAQGKPPVQKRLLVAHSQGGVRALALARLTENRNKVAAVITVNSPVRGHSGLDKDYGVMKRKLVEATYPILDAYYSIDDAINAVNWIPFVVNITETMQEVVFDGNGLPRPSTLKNLVGTNKEQYTNFVEKLPGQFDTVRNGIASFTGLPATLGSVTEFWRSIDGIRDLAPGSAFMQKYVEPGATAGSTSTGTFYRYQVGTTQTASVRWVHHSFMWWSWDSPEGINYGTVPAYKYAFVRQTVGVTSGSAPSRLYASDSTFPASTPIGFVQGTNASLDQFMKDAQHPDTQPDSKIREISSTLEGVKTGLNVVGTLVFIAAGVALAFGLWLAAIVWVIASFVCFNSANRVMWGRQSLESLVPTLLGSSSHDGLIPAGDQWRPLDGTNGIGGRALTQRPKIPYVTYDTTHEGARFDARIWGAGGSIGQFSLAVTRFIDPKKAATAENVPLVRQWIQSTFTDQNNPPAGFAPSEDWVGEASFVP